MAHVSYLNKLTPKLFGETVQKVAAAIVEHFPDCNLVASRGLSGTMLVPAVASFLGLEWGVVRKDEGNNHSGNTAEVSMFPKETKAVFLDDLVSSGETFRATVTGIETHVRQYFRNKDESEKPSVTWLGGILYDQAYDDRVRLPNGERVTCYPME